MKGDDGKSAKAIPVSFAVVDRIDRKIEILDEEGFAAAEMLFGKEAADEMRQAQAARLKAKKRQVG